MLTYARTHVLCCLRAYVVKQSTRSVPTGDRLAYCTVEVEEENCLRIAKKKERREKSTKDELEELKLHPGKDPR